MGRNPYNIHMKNNTNRINLISFKTVIFTFLIILSSSNAFSYNYTAFRTATPPVIDGIGNEDCWKSASWALINQPFDGLTLPDSANFYGRYKVVWDASRVYVLMEITDDKLVDNRVNPRDNYWEDDCAEFFIDEDHTPEGHECGVNAFNAFAYHIAATPRDKNNYINGNIVSFDSPNGINHVVDEGYSCNTDSVLNLDDHVKVKISKNGNKYTWELEFKIFDKNYNQYSNSNIPVTLTANKIMGFAIAYCDDDDGNRDHMIGTIPNHNDYNGPFPFYRFTNELGTLTLNDSVLTSTTMVIEKNKFLNTILWPNPIANTLNINIDNDTWQYIDMKILSLSGQVIFSQKVENKNTPIDVSKLSSGEYILELSNSVKIYRQKFIKE